MEFHSIKQYNILKKKLAPERKKDYNALAFVTSVPFELSVTTIEDDHLVRDKPLVSSIVKPRCP
jgi:hypothetical protein